MNSVVRLIAKRYLSGVRHERNISFMAIICFLSICIGSCALALVMSVMDGFEKATCEKIRSIHPQIIIKQPGHTLDDVQIESILNKEFKDVNGVSPQRLGHVIIQSQSSKELNNIVVLHGVDPEKEALTSSIGSKIIKPTAVPKLADIIRNNYVLIGEKCAADLGVTVNDTITLVHTDDTTDINDVKFSTTRAFVGGIFKTGIEEFDGGLALCGRQLFNRMFDDQGADQIAISLKPGANEHAVMNQLKERFEIGVFSWQDLYPALVSALKLEKYVMFFILTLISIVAAMNMISLLFMHITQKKGDIAILQAMGMKQRDIRWVFLSLGVKIAFWGSMCGLFGALLIGIFLKHCPLITLPDVYYVSTLPINLNIFIFFVIFLTTLCISIIASWLPTRTLNRIKIIDILRFQS